MKFAFGILPALALGTVLLLSPQPSFANCGNDKPVGNGCTTDVRGAPAPLLGMGLPGLAIGIGYGAYLFARRRRSAS